MPTTKQLIEQLAEQEGLDPDRISACYFPLCGNSRLLLGFTTTLTKFEDMYDKHLNRMPLADGETYPTQHYAWNAYGELIAIESTNEDALRKLWADELSRVNGRVATPTN